MKAFISYSHKDEWALDRLHTHLSVLRREGAIEAWFDQKILAGGEFDNDISAELEHCELFIALVSPDFLHSDYCVEQEMRMAEEYHEAGRLRIVPIIVDDCEWQKTTLGRFKALPKDGKAIRNWTNENTAFLSVVSELRRLINAAPAKITEPHAIMADQPTQTAGSYRIARTFDDIDRMDFLNEAYAIIEDHFQRSIQEIDTLDGVRARFSKTDERSFTAVITNQLRNQTTGHITVFSRSGTGVLGDITYSYQKAAPPNTANGWYNIEADDYELYFKGSGFGVGDVGPEERLNSLGVAKDLWKKLLTNAQISND